jgi:hypothetical protein
MSIVRVPGPLVRLENSYEVRFRPAFWKEIQPIAERFKAAKLHPYWVGPSGAATAYKEEVAYRILQEEKREWLRGEKLMLSVRLLGQRHDVDCTKVLADAAAHAGRIKNDKQITELWIVHLPADKPAVEFELGPWEENL